MLSMRLLRRGAQFIAQDHGARCRCHDLCSVDHTLVGKRLLALCRELPLMTEVWIEKSVIIIETQKQKHKTKENKKNKNIKMYKQ